MSVDTLGLVLRVFVTAASVGEREGGKGLLKRVKRMGKQVSCLHTIWVDGGNDCEPFMQWIMDCCRWTRAGGAATATDQRLRHLEEAVGGGAYFRLADGMSAIGQRL